MIDIDQLYQRATGSSQRPALRMPSYVSVHEVVADLYPGRFERIPLCLAAAVYRVPGRRRPRHLPQEPARLMLVAVYADPTDRSKRHWLEALLGEETNP